ncbi:MAG: ATP-grasp domain-containing protein [Myxococcales bacterium]|nr:ATP-grasp domain-containing protein [Myxococcales bacterium]
MRTVLFVAPFLMEATLKFVQAAATVQNARIVVLTADKAEKVPAGCIHYHVSDPTSAGQLIAAGRAIAREAGPIHRVIGILENVQEQIAMLREALGVSGPDVATAERFRDKSVMKDALRAAGLPCARHKLLFTQADAHAFVREVGFPIVLKPPSGAGCKATYRLGDAQALAAALAEIRPSPDRVVLAEEFVSGEEHCYDTITIGGKTVFQNIGRYYPGPLDVTRNDWIQWCVVLPRDISGAEFDPVRKVGPAVIKALGLRTGMTHMEWFRRPDGSPVVSEIGARPPGAQFVSVMSCVHDRSMYQAWAQAVIDDKVEGPFERKYAAGVAFLRGTGSGRVARVDNIDKAQSLMGKLVVEAQLPVVGREKSTSYEGDGFVILRHPDTAVVEHALETLIQTVHVHYE